jgi:hypothetical protein
MCNKSLLLNKEIVIVNWDWPNDKGPKYVEAILTKCRDDSKYEISLLKPLMLPDGTTHQKLVIDGRHKGFPVTRIVPNLVQKIFIFKHPLSKLVAPSVAVNIYTETGSFFSIASIYLKSVYLKAIGK